METKPDCLNRELLYKWRRISGVFFKKSVLKRGLNNHKAEEKHSKAVTFYRLTPLGISVSSGDFNLYTNTASIFLHLASVNSISSKLSYDRMRTRTVW